MSLSTVWQPYIQIFNRQRLVLAGQAVSQFVQEITANCAETLIMQLRDAAFLFHAVRAALLFSGQTTLRPVQPFHLAFIFRRRENNFRFLQGRKRVREPFCLATNIDTERR